MAAVSQEVKLNKVGVMGTAQIIVICLFLSFSVIMSDPSWLGLWAIMLAGLGAEWMHDCRPTPKTG